MSATQKTFLHAKNKGLIGILYIWKSVIYHPHPLTTTTIAPSAKHVKINFVRVTLNIIMSPPEILTSLELPTLHHQLIPHLHLGKMTNLS